MKKVLVTGGAGYKGTLLVEALLNEGHQVTIFDNFMYGFDPVLSFSRNPDCRVIKKDIRNIEKKDVDGQDVVVHLGGISGYPACEANPHSAQHINVISTRQLVSLLEEDQILAYASTTSMYGKSGEEQDETAKPTPVSLYGITKYEAERICMARKNSVAFRFATLYGASLKMRNDLLLNDFVHKAVTERSLVLFDSFSIRTFLHVKDAIEAYMMTVRQPEKLMGEVFNVGDNSMNHSKLDLAKKIKECVPMEVIESTLDDPDRRHFIINFNKFAAQGFKPTITVDQGIEELVRLYQWYRPNIPYQTI